eukprot:1438770-Pyramimonas_sp.AAC.1
MRARLPAYLVIPPTSYDWRSIWGSSPPGASHRQQHPAALPRGRVGQGAGTGTGAKSEWLSRKVKITDITIDNHPQDAALSLRAVLGGGRG